LDLEDYNPKRRYEEEREQFESATRGILLPGLALVAGFILAGLILALVFA
jgi:hypothetical protein